MIIDQQIIKTPSPRQHCSFEK